MSSAAHDHSHDPAGAEHGHDHAVEISASNAGKVRFVFLLTAAFAVVQVIAGWMAGSLALIADAGHMASDSAALLLAMLAYRWAARAPDARRTYGYDRARVLAALVNGAALFLLVIWIGWEALQRLWEPQTVLAWPMLAVALVGLAVNLLGAWILRHGDRADGNLRGAYLHVLGDLLGSVGAIAAAIGILLTGWMPLDPLLSVLVAMLVLVSAWRLVRESLDVLLQSAPPGFDPARVEVELARLPGVAAAWHLHAWTLADTRCVATVDIAAAEDADPFDLPQVVGTYLRKRHGIAHATVQVHRLGVTRTVGCARESETEEHFHEHR